MTSSSTDHVSKYLTVILITVRVISTDHIYIYIYIYTYMYK